MNTPIAPRLFELTAICSNKTITAIFTDFKVAMEVENDLWKNGGAHESHIYFADEAIDGFVIWEPITDLVPLQQYN